MSDASDILDPAVAEYLRGFGTAPHPVIATMEARARETDFPIVGPLVGAFLRVLVCSAGVRTIFELGSGFGYSAIWMALALPEGGTITCTETSAENLDLARGYLDQAGAGDRVELLEGDGLEILGRRAGPFDMVFSDVDKRRYPETLPLVLPRLRRPGGLFLADNVLWSGRVARGDQDEHTRAIVPLRDGVSVSVRI